MPKITKRTVDALSANRAGKEVFFWDKGDGALKGFGVRKKPSGVASYVVQYRTQQGRTRRLTIGRIGVLTPDEARKLAAARLSDVARGGDPSASRRAERNALTIANLCREYLDKAERSLIITRRGEAKRSSTLATDRGRIERHIVPLLGSRTVKDVSQKDVRDFMRGVIEGKTAINVKTKNLRGRARVTGGTGTAARTVGLLGAIFSYAVEEGYCERNPVHGIRRPSDGRREIPLDPAQLLLIGGALDAAETEGAHWQGLAIVRLLALTGLRPGEIARLRWQQVDTTGRVLRFGQTKEGRHRLRPMSRPALAILKDAREKSGNGEYVFPGVRKQSVPFSYANTWKLIRAKTGVVIPPYGFRHIFSSTANELGYSQATIGALVGNGGRGVTGDYIHHSDCVLLAAADRIAQSIQSMMTGERAEVITLSAVA